MIEKTQSATPLEPVEIAEQPNGLLDVWLRRNILETQTDDGPVWTAEELHFISTTLLTVEQIGAQFDVLWLEHAPEEIETIAVADLVETLDDWSAAADLDVSFRQVYQAVVLNRAPDSITVYEQPSGYHNAYLRDTLVEHEGLTYQATRDGATGIPGQSPDWKQVAEDGEELDWVQPHAGSEWAAGVIVRHKGHRWQNDLGRPNGWEPGALHSGWTDLGPI